MTNALRERAVGPTEFLDPPATLRQAEFPARNVGCDPQVDYKHMDDVLARARMAFPNATKLVPLWMRNGRVRVAVEVWTGVPGTMGYRARVVPEDRI